MDSDLKRSLDTIQRDVSDIKVTAARQEENLKEHMRRTELAEEGIKLARIEAATKAQALEEELRPVKNHVMMVNGVLKFIGLIGLLVGIAATILKFIGFQ